MNLHFNSHAHVERDNNVAVATLQQTISTHTLTWSVTPNNYTDKIDLNISTHTLTWSVTIQTKTENLDLKISTHTLTWSVTLSSGQFNSTVYISTHTLTWSVTLAFLKLLSRPAFQLTRSRGAWQTSSFYDGKNKHFNSHAHVERDLFLTEKNGIQKKFQLTRSRGAWRARKCC